MPESCIFKHPDFVFRFSLTNKTKNIMSKNKKH